MAWPFSAFAKWAKEQGVKAAQSPEERLELARQRVAIQAASEAARTVSTMKKVVAFCLLNGVAWVWCSYILAFLGHDTIAESLSQVALAEIIGVVLVYAVKSLVENLSKNNHWPDKSPLSCDSDISTTTTYEFEGTVGSDNEEDYSDE